jgi:carbon storage regulator
MLLLSRKKDEKIRINDDVTIVVIEIRGDRVRLGVEAPQATSVYREELYQAIQHQAEANQEGTSVTEGSLR